MNVTNQSPLVDICSWIDKDFLEEKPNNLYNLHRKNIDKIYEVDTDKLINKYGQKGFEILCMLFSDSIFVPSVYKLLLFTNHKGFYVVCCTMDNHTIEWGIFYPIYQFNNPKDYCLKQTNYRPKIVWKIDRCKKAYLLFKRLNC